MVRTASDKLYTGIAVQVIERVKKHNTGKGAKCLLGQLPVVLVYLGLVGSYSEALKEEARIKKLTKKQKEALVEENLDV